MNSMLDKRVLDHMAMQQQQLRAYAPGMGYGDSAGQAQRPRVQPTPQLWTPARGRAHSFIVAASDAHTNEKEQADIVCDGTDDQEQITAALDEAASAGAASGGSVLLSTGNFYLSDSIVQPFGTSLIGVDRDATLVHALDCHAITVTDVARIERMTFYNENDNSAVDGIRAEPTDDLLWLIGDIADCWFFGFGTDINLYVGQWQIDRCMFWNVQSGFTPWGIKIHNHPTSGIVNEGENYIRFCHFVRGNGIYIGDADPDQNLVLGCTWFGDSSDVSVQIDSGNNDNRVGYCNFDSGQVIIDGSDNRFSNNTGGVGGNPTPVGWSVGGDRNVIHDTHGAGRLTIAATADSTRYWANDFGTIVDNGTNTKKNLDGSANDWNW